MLKSLIMNKLLFSTKKKSQSDEDVLDKISDQFELMLYNDDFNTFDWVIESLIEVCKHDEIQAEQCAFIVHFNGKCAVKAGDFSLLEPMHRALSGRDLTVEIE